MTLARADLQVLYATACRPAATAAELSPSLHMEPSTVSRTRRRLERLKVWAPAFALDTRRLESDPVISFRVETNGSSGGRDVAAALRRALADLDLSGGFLVDERHAFGLCVPRGVARLQALESRVLGLERAAGAAPVVGRHEHAIYPGGAGTRMRWPDFVPFLRAVLMERIGATPQVEPEAHARAARRPRALSTTELLVAKELLTNPARTLAESTRAVRLPSSTFAHVKMTLLEEGILRPTARVDPAAVGYPRLLLTARAHRPHDPHALETDLAHHPCAATAPIALMTSDTHGFAITPIAEAVCELEAVADFERRSARFDPTAPVSAIAFDAGRAHAVGYTSPADAFGAAFRSWVAP
jgi:DNA-binding Lrp family transcriptional regulator